MADSTDNRVIVHCDTCGRKQKAKPAKDGSGKLPMAWKRVAGAPMCKQCFADRYVLRAVEIPIAGPWLGVGQHSPEDLKAAWKELREDLRAAWRATTQIANFLTNYLATNDFVRDASMETMPKLDAGYLYPIVRQRFPDYPSGAVSGLIQSITGQYSSSRYQTRWTCSATTRNYKYPTPYAVRAQDWTAQSHCADGSSKIPLVKLPINGRSWTLRLAILPSNAGYQIQRFWQLLSGEAIRADCVIRERRVGANGNRPGGSQAANGGGQTHATRLICKLVGYFPKVARDNSLSGTLTIETSDQHFVCCYGADPEKPWRINGDHVRRWVIAHQEHLHRLSDDIKAETRRSRGRRRQHKDHYEKVCQKYRDRIKSWIDESTAWIVGYVNRHKIARVEFHDVSRAYFPDGKFDWSGWRNRLADKLRAMHVEFANGSVDEKPADPLAETPVEDGQ